MTLTHQLIPKLKSLRLSGILETLELRNRQAVEEQLSFVEFLQRLLEDEVERRAQKQLTLRLRRASFDLEKTLEAFDFSFNPTIVRQQLFDLATARFVERHENVLIQGPASASPTSLRRSAMKRVGAALTSSSPVPAASWPISTAGAPTAPTSGSGGWRAISARTS